MKSKARPDQKRRVDSPVKRAMQEQYRDAVATLDDMLEQRDRCWAQGDLNGASMAAMMYHRSYGALKQIETNYKMMGYGNVIIDTGLRREVVDALLPPHQGAEPAGGRARAKA